MDTILQWNCNGCINNLFQLKLLTVNTAPFCICLQETHFKPDTKFSLRGYNIYRKDIIPNLRARGGIAILLKDNIPINNIRIQSRLQVIAVQILYPLKITICNIYLPDIYWNSDDLKDIINQLPTPFIIVGDFNSHNPLWGSDRLDTRGRTIEELINEFDLVLLNTGEGTYFNSRSNTFSRLDLSMCSAGIAHNFRWTVLQEQLFTDHAPIQINCSTRLAPHTIPKRWKIKKANWEKFQTQLVPLELKQTTNDSVKEITNNIISAANLSIPKTNGLVKTPRVPWWNEETQNATKEKKRALAIFKRNPTTENLINFKRFRSRARRLIIQQKRKCWENYVSTLNGETPTIEVWEKIRNIVGKKFKMQSPILIINGTEIQGEKNIANELAKHFEFTSSTKNYSIEFQTQKCNLEVELNFSENSNSIYNNDLTMFEFEKAMEETKSSAPGKDQIHYDMIKNLPSNEKEQVLRLFNLIWSEGVYPESWQTSIIIPIPKPGKDSTNPNNYRPISLTSCFSKLMEKIINARLVWYLETNNYISNYQTGFRKYRSTADQIVLLDNAIKKSFAERKHLIAVSFDLEKAFDLTWRYNILKTLHEWGLRGRLPTFIRNFLKNRNFSVRIGDTLSDERTLENGIPQGSTISVTLFLIAINKLVESIDNSIGKSLYVDDLIIYFSGRHLYEVEEKLQTVINQLIEKADSLGFRFSSSKTHCIDFCRLRTRHNDPTLYIKGNRLEVKNTTKILGMIFDRKLSWKQHIEDLANRCKKTLNIIKCVSNINWGADREVLLNIYKSLILSKMEYGSTIYSSACKTRLYQLEKIHKEGIRLATGAFRTSPNQAVFCESGIPSFLIRRNQLQLNYGVKIWSQPNHPNHSDMYNININKTIGNRIQKELNELDFTLPPIFPLQHNEVAPWTMKLPNIHFDCKKYKKENTNRTIYLQIFHEIVNKYNECTVIYTDGSKTDRGVGSAFSHMGETYWCTLNPLASIYTAELFAILQSLRFIDILQRGTYLICTDSCSSLLAIKEGISNDPLVQNILTMIHLVENTGKNINFLWIPGHIGIAGNELADTAARLATDEPYLDDIPIRPDDLKTYLKTKIKQKWNQEWNNSNHKLKHIKSNAYEQLPFPTNKRREQVALTRMRIGHTNLTHIHLLCGNRPPLCTHCNEQQTVEHFIIECPVYTLIRNKYNLPNSLQECLKNVTNCDKSLKFITETNLIKKI